MYDTLPDAFYPDDVFDANAGSHLLDAAYGQRNEAGYRPNIAINSGMDTDYHLFTAKGAAIINTVADGQISLAVKKFTDSKSQLKDTHTYISDDVHGALFVHFNNKPKLLKELKHNYGVKIVPHAQKSIFSASKGRIDRTCLARAVETVLEQAPEEESQLLCCLYGNKMKSETWHKQLVMKDLVDWDYPVVLHLSKNYPPRAGEEHMIPLFKYPKHYKTWYSFKIQQYENLHYLGKGFGGVRVKNITDPGTGIKIGGKYGLFQDIPVDYRGNNGTVGSLDLYNAGPKHYLKKIMNGQWNQFWRSAPKTVRSAQLVAPNILKAVKGLLQREPESDPPTFYYDNSWFNYPRLEAEVLFHDYNQYERFVYAFPKTFDNHEISQYIFGKDIHPEFYLQRHLVSVSEYRLQAWMTYEMCNVLGAFQGHAGRKLKINQAGQVMDMYGALGSYTDKGQQRKNSFHPGFVVNTKHGGKMNYRREDCINVHNDWIDRLEKFINYLRENPNNRNLQQEIGNLGKAFEDYDEMVDIINQSRHLDQYGQIAVRAVNGNEYDFLKEAMIYKHPTEGYYVKIGDLEEPGDWVYAPTVTGLMTRMLQFADWRERIYTIDQVTEDYEECPGMKISVVKPSNLTRPTESRRRNRNDTNEEENLQFARLEAVHVNNDSSDDEMEVDDQVADAEPMEVEPDDDETIYRPYPQGGIPLHDDPAQRVYESAEAKEIIDTYVAPYLIVNGGSNTRGVLYKPPRGGHAARAGSLLFLGKLIRNFSDEKRAQLREAPAPGTKAYRKHKKHRKLP